MINERASIEDVLELARQITMQLEPIVQQAADTQGLCLRLAHAHALGLVDQLCEMTAGYGGSPNVQNAMRAAFMLDEEIHRTA